jgi:hypothetical protein
MFTMMVRITEGEEPSIQEYSAKSYPNPGKIGPVLYYQDMTNNYR